MPRRILYDTLVSITEDGYEGCLAESWTISEDGKIYTLKSAMELLFGWNRLRCQCNLSEF